LTARFQNGSSEINREAIMSVFGNIVSAIFGKVASAAAAATGTSGAGAGVDVAAVCTKLAAANPEKLDWKNSIVDLMKLLNLDSSVGARKSLAQELKYTGDMNDSATMNVWLHKQVMQKLADNGGKVSPDLMTK
jgi:hypothetical protein